MADDTSPRPLSEVLSQLMQLRGYNQVQGDDQLRIHWKQIVPPAYASMTRPAKVMRGVLQVYVSHPAALSELSGFHQQPLVEKLQKLMPELKLKDIKFRLG
ncbi:MAG: hypothetical protein C0478_15335 [Planctomyces sp.]|jgi:predicted nucleic acid-binding Zn ribbon protein|nr:hypothetical protein [Planctomyces sp.]